MTAISEVLGASEDLSKVSEDFQHLERCYESISNSVNAAVAELFAELSQLEQGGTLASTKAKVLLAVKELKVPITLFRQNQKQLSIVSDRLEEIEAQLHASKLMSDFEGPEEIEKLKETVALVRKRSVLVYTLLTKSVHESWNYFPIELHQVFEDLADHLDCRQEVYSDIAESILLKHRTAAKNFIYSVRKAVEENKLKPKWHLYTQQKVLPEFAATGKHPPSSNFQEIEDTIDSAKLRRALEDQDDFVTLDKTVDLTLEEFWALPEGETAYELVDGKAIPKVSPKEFHSTLTFALTVLLTKWAKARGRIRLEWALTLKRDGRDWSPVPEVTYVSYERLPKSIFRNQACPVPPELVIEIISPGQTFKHFEEKAKDYFNAGVLRVWVVDPEAINITVFLPDGTRSLYTGNTKIIDTLLPGLELTPQLIFEEAELL